MCGGVSVGGKPRICASDIQQHNGRDDHDQPRDPDEHQRKEHGRKDSEPAKNGEHDPSPLLPVEYADTEANRRR